jgi:hypothetical protein
MMKPVQAAILIILRTNSTERNLVSSASSQMSSHDNILTFSIAPDTKYLDDAEDKEEDGDPDGNVDMLSRRPELNCNTRSNEFEGEDRQPGNCVFPTNSETPRRVNESDNVGKEGTIDRVKDCHFSKSLGGKHQHDTDNKVSDDLSVGGRRYVN